MYKFFKHKSIFLSIGAHIVIAALVALIIGLSFLIVPDEYKIESALIIAVLSLFGIVVFRDFFQALCIFIFINPLLFYIEVGSNFPMSLQGLISILIILVGFSYFLLKRGLVQRKRFPAITPFLLILSFSSLSIFYSPDIPSLLVKIGRIASYFSLYILLLANLDSWKKIESSIQVVYLSYLGPFLIAVPQFIGVFTSGTKLLDLEKIGIMSKNSFGIIVAMLTLFLVGRNLLLRASVIHQMRKNILYLIPLVIFLIMSITRTAWLGVFGALFLVPALYGRAKNKLIILSCFLIIILIFWSPIVEGVSDLINTRLLQGSFTTINSAKGSFEGRLFIYWPQGINAWLEHPILGHGLGSTKYLMYRSLNYVEKPPHNEYVQILQEIGVIGFILYLFLLWNFLWPILSMLKDVSKISIVERQRGILLGAMMVFVGFVIMSVGQETFHNGSIGTLFVLFMAIAQATYLLLKKELQSLHPQNKDHFNKFYTLRSLPQFLISVILACPESFLRSRTSRKDFRQAGMTLKTNIQFQTPCGLCRRVLHLANSTKRALLNGIN